MHKLQGRTCNHSTALLSESPRRTAGRFDPASRVVTFTFYVVCQCGFS